MIKILDFRRFIEFDYRHKIKNHKPKIKMTFQEIPQLIEKVREKYPVADVEIRFPYSGKSLYFAVRVDVHIDESGKIVEYSTCWRGAEAHHTVDSLLEELFYELKSEMGLLE